MFGLCPQDKDKELETNIELQLIGFVKCVFVCVTEAWVFNSEMIFCTRIKQISKYILENRSQHSHYLFSLWKGGMLASTLMLDWN